LFNTDSKTAEGSLSFDTVPKIDDRDMYDVDIDSLLERPWLRPGADVTAYFNYGFTETTWKIYCERQRQLKQDASSIAAMVGVAVSGNPALKRGINVFQSEGQAKGGIISETPGTSGPAISYNRPPPAITGGLPGGPRPMAISTPSAITRTPHPTICRKAYLLNCDQ